MLIDWFTVGAQVLNFAILVWLMRRFLYQPVQDAIAAREKRIADTLAEAEAKKADAQQSQEAFRQKNDSFDRERDALWATATADANAERQRLVDAARQSADALTARRHDALASEAQGLSDAVRGRAQEEVFAVARRALADLAGANLEAAACDAFTQRLRALAGADRATLATALEAAHHSALVRSAFPLPEAQRAAVLHAVNETFSIDAALQFDTAPSLVAGIELSAHGQKLAWSIAGYLGALDRGVSSLLNINAKAPEPVSTAPEPAATSSP